MNNDDIKKLIDLRTKLINEFNRRRDYKTNENAIMKEYDHAKLINETIKQIDNILKNHVSFS